MIKSNILYILWNFIIFSSLLLSLNTGGFIHPSNNSSELPKVVVVKPDMPSGFGNRMPGIICGFLYSLISDRLFFMDGNHNFDNYFEKDFDHNWDTVSYLYKESTAKDLHIQEKINNFTLVTRGNFSSEEINSYDILRVHTLDYICARLSSNPYYKKWFNKIIPDYRIFTTISLRLLRLHPDLKSQVEDYAKNNFNNYNIGIHLRENKFKTPWMIPIEHYYEIIHSEDNMDLHNSITWENSGTEAGAIIDLKLLGLCDDLVITYASSFGLLAAGWTHKASRQRGLFVINPIKINLIDNLQVVDKVWMWVLDRVNRVCT
ncbi:hypothetical protein F8M41_021906 [Gigaspora margarita]|uniref:Fucosyltransferase n=1 Tax=Gigaspora margarita TaxID=4874 RepID=A0A8H4ETK2_GIGMA|nr:hypothetical protein F8M41_021906 [Gigaspora margarita]